MKAYLQHNNINRSEINQKITKNVGLDLILINMQTWYLMRSAEVPNELRYIKIFNYNYTLKMDEDGIYLSIPF